MRWGSSSKKAKRARAAIHHDRFPSQVRITSFELARHGIWFFVLSIAVQSARFTFNFAGVPDDAGAFEFGAYLI